MKARAQKLLSLALLFPALSAASLAENVPGKPLASTTICAGTFKTDKYPVPHLVYLNRATGCFKRWTVTKASPYDVQCAFELSSVAKSPAEESKVLTDSEVDAYLDAVEANRWEMSAGKQQFKFSGFRKELNPQGIDQICK